MKEIKVDSSNIKSIFYDESRDELYMFFHKGGLYVYPCSRKIYDSFVSSTDKDVFFNKHFRDKKYVFKVRSTSLISRA